LARRDVISREKLSALSKGFGKISGNLAETPA